ncbi:MAG: hypothetical protein ONB32_13355 [candidate division KSB1 bacterium]|nr:hypothetical protein [candidate division KSB1 bacterium]
MTFLLEFYRHLCKALECLPYEYKSQKKFLGIPLLSINLGFDNPEGVMRHARGIVSIGNKATGVFALGIFVARGVVILAPLALGIASVSMVSFALISVSVIGIGLVSVSVFAFGYLAVGIIAIGYKSIGILAFGKDAVGIIAIGQKVRSFFSI